ncbi:DUF1700 domain-containing protein [Caviibacter abscessus]|uniref:DUF1700 domain-containing protein n=1 Tax=Caviibacter abscessus TaxID=1766719 RepID=UPI0008343355|nr:DUF1700 domain-containing protein [Caviibacter abscessus]
MKAREFMRNLDKYLKDFPYDEKIELFKYYEEYFQDLNLEKDDEIPESMDPKKIANDILLEYNIRNTKNNKKSSNPFSFMVLLILTIIGAPLSIPIIIAFIVVLFSIIAIIFALILAFGILIFIVPSVIIYYTVFLGTYVSSLITIGSLITTCGLMILTYGIIKFLFNIIANIYNKILIWIYDKIKK